MQRTLINSFINDGNQFTDKFLEVIPFETTLSISIGTKAQLSIDSDKTIIINKADADDLINALVEYTKE